MLPVELFQLYCIVMIKCPQFQFGVFIHTSFLPFDTHVSRGQEIDLYLNVLVMIIHSQNWSYISAKFSNFWLIIMTNSRFMVVQLSRVLFFIPYDHGKPSRISVVLLFISNTIWQLRQNKKLLYIT